MQGWHRGHCVNTLRILHARRHMKLSRRVRCDLCVAVFGRAGKGRSFLIEFLMSCVNGELSLGSVSRAGESRKFGAIMLKAVYTALHERSMYVHSIARSHILLLAGPGTARHAHHARA